MKNKVIYLIFIGLLFVINVPKVFAADLMCVYSNKNNNITITFDKGNPVTLDVFYKEKKDNSAFISQIKGDDPKQLPKKCPLSVSYIRPWVGKNYIRVNNFPLSDRVTGSIRLTDEKPLYDSKPADEIIGEITDRQYKSFQRTFNYCTDYFVRYMNGEEGLYKNIQSCFFLLSNHCNDKSSILFKYKPVEMKNYCNEYEKTGGEVIQQAKTSHDESPKVKVWEQFYDYLKNPPERKKSIHISCEDFEYVEKDEDGKIIKSGNIIKEIYGIVMIIAPILVILLGSLDYAKATFASDEDAVKKAQANFMKRILAAILLFLLPSIIKVMFAIAIDAGIEISRPIFCIFG